MKISVIGAGYVGLSMAVLLSEQHEVIILDVISEKIKMINKGVSPIADADIQHRLSGGNLNLKAVSNYEECKNSDYYIIATPTNYDPVLNAFDTRSIEDVVDNIEIIDSEASVVIKSTVPIGYTSRLQERKKNLPLIYSPEFLREGKSLYDNLHPSRIVVGSLNKNAETARSFADLLGMSALKKDIETLVTGFAEAESIKLFSNSYLAMRVSYFNELDSFAEVNGLDAKDIIRGVSLDPRIGDYYNNPSFGYGGYCLPKDAMQLCSNYGDIPNSLVSAIVESNQFRREYIANRIDELVSDRDAIIGAFRLNMKSDSDNSREASVVHVIEILERKGYKIIVYEPLIGEDYYNNYYNVKDLGEFKRTSDLILANRMSDELDDVMYKVYSRDIYRRD